MIWSPLLLLLSSQETLFLELCGRTREENHQGIARSKVAWCLQSPPLGRCDPCQDRWTTATEQPQALVPPRLVLQSTYLEHLTAAQPVNALFARTKTCLEMSQNVEHKHNQIVLKSVLEEIFLKLFWSHSINLDLVLSTCEVGGTHCWISSKPWVLLGLVTSTNHQQSDLGPLTPLLGKLILNWIILLVFSRILELIFPIFMHHWIFYCQWLRQ